MARLPSKGRKSPGLARQADIPGSYAEWQRVNYGNRLITPALIDAHTHVVFGGNRAVGV